MKTQTPSKKTASNLAEENQKLQEDLLKTLEAGDSLARIVAYALAHFRLGFKKTEKDNFENAFKNWIALKESLK